MAPLGDKQRHLTVCELNERIFKHLVRLSQIKQELIITNLGLYTYYIWIK